MKQFSAIHSWLVWGGIFTIVFLLPPVLVGLWAFPFDEKTNFLNVPQGNNSYISYVAPDDNSSLRLFFREVFNAPFSRTLSLVCFEDKGSVVQYYDGTTAPVNGHITIEDRIKLTVPSNTIKCTSMAVGQGFKYHWSWDIPIRISPIDGSLSTKFVPNTTSYAQPNFIENLGKIFFIVITWITLLVLFYEARKLVLVISKKYFDI